MSEKLLDKNNLIQIRNWTLGELCDVKTSADNGIKTLSNTKQDKLTAGTGITIDSENIIYGVGAGSGLGLNTENKLYVNQIYPLRIDGSNQLTLGFNTNTLKFDYSAEKLGVNLASAGGLSSSSNGIAVNVDSSTISLNSSSQLQATNVILTDASTSTKYKLVINNGTLGIEEV